MTERFIDLPDGPLLQKLADYIVGNREAAAHIQGFLEGKGETIGTCRLEITAARLVLDAE